MMAVYVTEGQRLVFFANAFCLCAPIASAGFIALFFIFGACKIEHSTMVPYEDEKNYLNFKTSQVLSRTGHEGPEGE
jgi:hypothetical protein